MRTRSQNALESGLRVTTRSNRKCPDHPLYPVPCNLSPVTSAVPSPVTCLRLPAATRRSCRGLREFRIGNGFTFDLLDLDSEAAVRPGKRPLLRQLYSAYVAIVAVVDLNR